VSNPLPVGGLSIYNSKSQGGNGIDERDQEKNEGGQGIPMKGGVEKHHLN
jgi:hypothetical protein